MLKLFGILFLIIVLFPQNAGAVPPPDLIMQVASQIANFFSIAFVFLLAILSTSYQFIKTRLLTVSKRTYWVVGILAIVFLAGAGAYYFDQVYQKKVQAQQYEQWLQESIEQSAQNAPLESTEKPQAIALTESKTEDPGEYFIRQYYQNIADHHFEAAYDVSKKSASFEVFVSWYQNVEKVTIDQIEPLKSNNGHQYSVSLSLFEKGEKTQYKTLFTLDYQDGKPVRIADTKTTVIPLKDAGGAGGEMVVSNALGAFWDQNKDLDLKITNQDFEALIKGPQDTYLILDARENIEYENGHLPGSTHIRFADLKEGEWQSLPKDKVIVVLCWSGMRGLEVAEFLREHYLVARYLEEGSNGWVSYGGQWKGEISFTKTYSDDRYKITYEADQVKQMMEDGVKIVDSRPPDKFAAHHIPGSINIPLMYTPTSKIEEVFGQLSGGGKVVTVCDDYINCFDARLTGVELERRGFEFLGRFSKPWTF